MRLHVDLLLLIDAELGHLLLGVEPGEAPADVVVLPTLLVTRRHPPDLLQARIVAPIKTLRKCS